MTGLVSWLLGVFGMMKIGPAWVDWRYAIYQDDDGCRREFLVFRSGHSVFLRRNTRLARHYFASTD